MPSSLNFSTSRHKKQGKVVPKMKRSLPGLMVNAHGEQSAYVDVASRCALTGLAYILQELGSPRVWNFLLTETSQWLCCMNHMTTWSNESSTFFFRCSSMALSSKLLVKCMNVHYEARKPSHITHSSLIQAARIIVIGAFPRCTLLNLDNTRKTNIIYA